MTRPPQAGEADPFIVMDYGARDRARYTPSLAEARDQGVRAIAAIGRWLPRERDVPILEIGSGPGNLLVGLRDAGYSHARGVDLAADLVRHGRDVLGVDTTVNDWTGEVRAGGPYALIVALDVLEHMPAQAVQETLTLTRQRLRPGGRLVLRLPNARCPYVLPMFHGDLTHRLLPDAGLLEHLLRTSGFAGRIEFRETRPHDRLKRALFLMLHLAVVKPLVSLLYYHFYQRWPGVVTPNMYCCAYVDGGDG